MSITINGVEANLEIHEATTLMGMRRGQLAANANDEDAILWFAHRFMYPDCLACTTGAIGSKPVGDLTFEEYMKLPDTLTESWLAAVYEVNPHWAPRLPNEGEQEKKASTRSGG